MWLVTPRGFYSVVQHDENPLDVLVRARAKADLENLCEIPGMESLARGIYYDSRADYPYRLRMPRADWMACLAVMGSEIDYRNVKTAVKERHSPERAHTLMGAWSALRRIEGERRRPPRWEPLFDTDTLDAPDYDADLDWMSVD